MPLIRVGASGGTSLKEQAYENEAELENVLAEHVELLREGDEPPLALVTSQLRVPGSGVADLVLIDAAGIPVVVEVKLSRNPQSRREVIAQVFDYAATLTDWTVDELNSQTEGCLEEALRSLSNGDDTNFKERWRSTGTNLRAGVVRVVVAVDQQTEDLSRIISYINDHSDLDVRLTVVKKYSDPSGDTVFSSTTPVLSEDNLPTSSVGGRTRAPELVAVLRSYEAIDERPLELSQDGRAIRYCQLLVPGWPEDGGVHYEFLVAGSRIHSEIHLESDDMARALAGTLEKLAHKLNSHFPDATCEFSPKWARGRGRLRVLHAKDVPPETIAANMVRLIEATRTQISDALGSEGIPHDDPVT